MSRGHTTAYPLIHSKWGAVYQTVQMMRPPHVTISVAAYVFSLYGEWSNLRVIWEEDGSGRSCVEHFEDERTDDVRYFLDALTEEQIVDICLQWLATEV